jgi:hypothetical protein
MATIVATVTSLPTGQYKADLDEGTRLGPYDSAGEAQRAADLIKGAHLRWVRQDLAGDIEHWVGEKT